MHEDNRYPEGVVIVALTTILILIVLAALIAWAIAAAFVMVV